MRWPAPLVISADGNQCISTPLEFGEPAFSEDRLQEIIAAHPQLLPVEHFDPIFGPAVLVGREIRTGAGPIDNLYVSPSGYLTLVETKLWKNPEARRQVVAQIIDYSKHLTCWGYPRLEQAYSDYVKKAGGQVGSLYSHVCGEADDGLSESEFIDAVSRCLSQGRFLLLIVGDGIRESVEEMAQYLQQTPNLQFALGLVEINCYRMAEPTGSFVLVPRILAKTKEIERAIVRIEMKPDAAEVVHVETDIPKPAAKRGNESRLSRDEFYSLLANEVGRESAGKLQSWLGKLAEENELMEEHFTPKKIRLKIELPTVDGDVIPLFDFSTDGSVTPAPLWRRINAAEVDARPFKTLFETLRTIDKRLAHERSADGTLKVRKGMPCDLDTVLQNSETISEASEGTF